MKKSAPLTAAAAGAIALCACTHAPQDSSAPEGGRSGGSFLDTLFGGLFSVFRNDDTHPGAFAGTAAAATGTAGPGLDVPARELTRSLTAHGATVTQAAGRIVVTLPQDQLFAPDSYDLRPGLKTDLLTLAGCLNRNPRTSVQVIGNSDDTGDAAYDRKLSQERADAVARTLIAAGVSPARVTAVGRGSANRVASDDTEEGRARNRRIEFVISSPTMAADQGGPAHPGGTAAATQGTGSPGGVR